MPVYYLYVYAPSDFVGGLPDEVSAAAAGTPTFTLQLLPGAVPTVIAVNDDDTIFDEVDATQSLDVAATIDGTTYGAGTTINTAYDLINTANGHKVTSFHFGGDGYQQGAVDGLVSTVELVPSTPYTFNTERTSHLQANPYDGYVACFVAGSRLLTPKGLVPVEALRPGDLVSTLDCGAMPLRWTGKRRVRGVGPLAPVKIPAGWNGLMRDLLVSPQHRMLVTGAGCELTLGCDSALISARQLADLGVACVVPRAQVTYHHVMFDTHEIVLAEGAPSESLLANDRTLTGFAMDAADELRMLFPELSSAPMVPARPILRAHEACLAVS
ncbi:hypothetical protein A8B78_05985 [Jannaschia sp. EhC01]|nr:hypothetical protein A8B78_05985 [Jannaschia sp. EhC01]